MSNVTLIQHPIVSHALTILRDKDTTTTEFRRQAAVVSKVLLVEATRNLPVTPQPVDTPLCRTEGSRLADDVVVVPVLRAGLAMLFAVQDFLPSVSVGFIGLERDEKTAQAREYYQKIPRLVETKKVFILDPMLATGGSIDDTVCAVKQKGARDITMICIVAAPEGIARVSERHPDARIITAAIDQSLNATKFIVPGLGDFGDRFFGTM